MPPTTGCQVDTTAWDKTDFSTPGLNLGVRGCLQAHVDAPLHRPDERTGFDLPRDVRSPGRGCVLSMCVSVGWVAVPRTRQGCVRGLDTAGEKVYGVCVFVLQCCAVPGLGMIGIPITYRALSCP